jgi:hypothetical protein
LLRLWQTLDRGDSERKEELDRESPQSTIRSQVGMIFGEAEVPLLDINPYGNNKISVLVIVNCRGS